MRCWLLESYDGVPAANATPVGSIVRTPEGGNPATWASGALGTHFNSATGDWVSARWVECDDPTGGAQ